MTRKRLPGKSSGFSSGFFADTIVRQPASKNASPFRFCASRCSKSCLPTAPSMTL